LIVTDVVMSPVFRVIYHREQYENKNQFISMCCTPELSDLSIKEALNWQLRFWYITN